MMGSDPRYILSARQSAGMRKFAPGQRVEHALNGKSGTVMNVQGMGVSVQWEGNLIWAIHPLAALLVPLKGVPKDAGSQPGPT